MRRMRLKRLVFGRGTKRSPKFHMSALVAQWIERLPPEQEVEGSNPFKGTFLLAYPLQRVDHFY